MAREREELHHEMANLLSILMGITATLLDGADQDEVARRRFLEILHQETRRLERLLHEFLGTEPGNPA